MRGTDARLTEAGELFLAGDWDFIEKNGINDWVGGVHLDSKSGNVWYYHNGLIIRSNS